MANVLSCASTPTKKNYGEIRWQLTDLDGLGMKEVVGEFTERQLGMTYFQGSELIDGIWATGNLTVANACVDSVLVTIDSSLLTL
jgi:hypothetical protein